MMQLEPNTNGSVPSLSSAQSLRDSSFVLIAQSLRDSSFVLSRFRLLTVAEVLPTVQTSQCLSSLGSALS